jgi:hypothetical protein
MDRRNRDGLETELRPPGNLVPNERHPSVEVVWFAVKRLVADLGDQGLNGGVIDLFGRNAFGARMACQT